MTDLSNVSVLVLGAGGLGCEILKNLAMQGIPSIHVVDMDTIELTNLNRQFLFSEADIGKSKAHVAAEFINGKRIPAADGTVVRVTPYFQDLTLFDKRFIASFTLIVSGLDSIEARRFVNTQLVQITLETKYEKCIPFIDGGSEGWKGHCKTIIPGFTACYECSLGTLPSKAESYPLCTIANSPRLPEHVIEYVLTVQWPREFPDQEFDGDQDPHLNWIIERSIQRARLFGIDDTALTREFVVGVVKNIIPSVASTNAVVAAQCCNEVTKLLYNIYDPESSPNFVVYNGDDGCFSYSFTHERLPDCLICGVLQ
ncbi:LAFE_0D08922g1_1 [Lachancea fermentati]|uniref:NEDD8-activating enzyme E1 catalytic subunit n=1 Tax=Lachancea fermentati TaxID=4955 RepID=A0A1G4MBN3_LACFM|nr:LAFE_0D08922g1_1 [Lachancea fermentati]